ncbi:MAG: TIM-barrel domain-containing protein [Pseudomonadota bacterium]
MMPNNNASQDFLIAGLALLLYSISATVVAQPQRALYEAQGNYLILEISDEDLIHLEYGQGPAPGLATPLLTTDMVCSASDNLPEPVCTPDHPGSQSFSDDGSGTLETQDLRLTVNPTNLALSVFDKTKNNLLLTTLRAENLGQPQKTLIGTRGAELDIYGLGQQFVDPGVTDIDWEGRVRVGSDFGNVMAGFNGGANGNTQIPIMYAVNGTGFENYALFLDNKYRQRWDFTSPTQWKVDIADGALRLFLMTGPDLLDLRKDFMDLVGHPLVPPKKMFGLWLSEYGYDDWGELEDKLSTLRQAGFPLDGFVLDLQWFGGISAGSDDTRMGSLTFDEVKFPNPQAKITGYQNSECAGIMLIEEAYVGLNLPEHSDLHSRDCLAKDRPGGTSPAYLTGNSWWGKGGMIDYTNDACGAYIHDNKRQALIDQGVIGHWTDLGEPEMFDPNSGYAVGDHADAHNFFNFRWIRSINEGYLRNNNSLRPFMMSRSGSAGIQRFGAAMWSGDIGSKLDNLDSHAANQKHMAFSGIDYYGSDIAGFHRGDIQNDPARKNELYTQWFAAGMMLDVPGRPHTENLCNCKETAPDRLGDLASNLDNARLRYRLIPYLYSLAHQAYLEGEPVMPPLVMHYQADVNVRNRGQEKLIGRDLLTAVIAEQDASQGQVYLPAGSWIDWHSNQRIHSTGLLHSTPLYRDNLFKLPLFARAGAIIPMAHVDSETLCSEGRRKDGSVRDELVVRLFDFAPDADGSNRFTLYEDDGKTIAYQQGEVRKTGLSFSTLPVAGDGATRSVQLEIEPAEGNYQGAPTARNNLLELVTNRIALGVSLDGQALVKQVSMSDFHTAAVGWTMDNGRVLAKSGVKPVAEAKRFLVELQEPSCTSNHQYISIPGAGNGWEPNDPLRRLSSCNGKVWSGELSLCTEAYKFAADGSWSVNWGCDGQQNGPNCPPLADGLYRVSFDEENPANPLFERIGDTDSCSTASRFVCENGETSWGASVYVVGNVPELGAWNPSAARILQPNGPYPTWTGSIEGLPTDANIEWKCIKRQEPEGGRVIQWEPGSNNVFDKTVSEQVGAF